MAVESDADRAAFLGDFNDQATYTPSGGSPATISGIFDNGFAAGSEASGLGVASSRPQWHCRAADVAADPVGGALAFNSVTYTIVEAEPDGTGMTMLFLEDQS